MKSIWKSYVVLCAQFPSVPYLQIQGGDPLNSPKSRIQFSFLSSSRAFCVPIPLHVWLAWDSSEGLSGIVPGCVGKGRSSVGNSFSQTPPSPWFTFRTSGDEYPYYGHVNQYNIFPWRGVEGTFLTYWVITSNNSLLQMWLSYLPTLRMLTIMAK